MVTRRTRVARLAALAGLVGGLALVSGAADDPLADYDPAEVAMLLEQAEVNGIDVTTSMLIDTLRFRDACRGLQATVAAPHDRARGDAIADVRRLAAEARQARQTELGDHVTSLVRQAERGDLEAARQFVLANCAGVDTN